MSASQPQQETSVNPHLSKFDLLWILNLFGTAVGAGILFLPITAGQSGIWPLFIVTAVVGPMTYFAHRGLSRMVLCSKSENDDITNVAEDFFGKIAGIIFTALYFMAIYPILCIYAVSITNTVQSFITNQLHYEPIPRVWLSLICVTAYIGIILCGRKMVLIFNEKLVYPLCIILLVLSVYLIPQWRLAENLSAVPETSEFIYTLWITLPVLVFAFNHSPAISTFAVDQKRHYGQQAADFYAARSLKYTSGTLVLFVMFFVFSCVLTLNTEELAQARAQNINILSFLANELQEPLIAIAGPVIAFLAISTSFFGHYLGAREGLNGLIVKLSKKGTPMVDNRRTTLITLFFFVSLWFVATVNPSILSLIETLSGPVIAMILFIMPMYAVATIPAMRRYAKQKSNIFVTVMGLLTIASLILSIF
ncbi:MAG: HAAAP family serine/threonine permease [Succinivibrio sp.]|nr:HAAAP family serine/threonine permease [Succinivibrio sp.]